MKDYLIAPNAIVEKGVTLGEKTKVWYFTHIREGAKIGENCNIGDHCYIDRNVIIGNNVRIGNGCDIYEGTIIKDRVTIGPQVVITNVKSVKIFERKKQFLDTIIDEDVAIGAKSVITAGIKVGKKSTIGEGSVVIYDVPEKEFFVGRAAHSANKKQTWTK